MKKFHITITNNETGEVVHDMDTGAIIGAIGGAEDEGAYSIGLTACNLMDLATAVASAKKAVDILLEKNPAVRLVIELASLKEVNDSENDN